MTKPSVAETITHALHVCGKSGVEVSREVGLPNSNFISMVKKGRAKLPLNRVPAVARAVGLEPRELFLMCLQEYDPALLQAMQECGFVAPAT